MESEQKLGKLQRIGGGFSEELKEIIDKIGKTRKEVSVERIMNLITKHDHWQEIKEDLINYDFEK